MANNHSHLLNYHDAIIYPSDLALLDSSTAWLNDACMNFQMTRLQQTQGDRRGATKEEERKGMDDDAGCIDQLEDMFIDPSVLSFLMHQLTEDDEDYDDELSNLNASWNLPKPPTSVHQCDGMKKLGKEALHAQKSTQTHQRKRIFLPISDQFGASRSTFARPGGGYHWSLLLWEINTHSDGFSASVGVDFHHFDSSRGYNASAAIAVAKKLLKVLGASMSKDDGVADVVEVLECQTPQQRNGYDCGVFALGFTEALSASDDYGFVKEDHEALLQSHFEEKGGHGEFASGLRKQIGDDIRALA
mmetsp:Transcript_14938/g.32421  ORF Transcript_14938/g.32421 Transcript_14938/m.32421 type:complete len:303 (+) Transcript_14938:17-925(+)